MVAGADVLIHAKARGLDAAALLDGFLLQGLFASLLVQHAL